LPLKLKCRKGKYLYLSWNCISLQFRLTRQTAGVVTSTIQKPFEILIFFSLDSNDGSAFFPLRADTVFRAVQID
jgi:hypothetical protein